MNQPMFGTAWRWVAIAAVAATFLVAPHRAMAAPRASADRTFSSRLCPYTITYPSAMKQHSSGREDDFVGSGYNYAIDCSKTGVSAGLRLFQNAFAAALRKSGYTITVNALKNGVGRVDANKGSAYTISAFTVRKGYRFRFSMAAGGKSILAKHQNEFFHMLDTFVVR